jgi:hypothetical protein
MVQPATCRDQNALRSLLFLNSVFEFALLLRGRPDSLVIRLHGSAFAVVSKCSTYGRTVRFWSQSEWAQLIFVKIFLFGSGMLLAAISGESL